MRDPWPGAFGPLADDIPPAPLFPCAQTAMASASVGSLQDLASRGLASAGGDTAAGGDAKEGSGAGSAARADDPPRMNKEASEGKGG